MKVISGKASKNLVKNFIHEKKQVHEESIDLTVNTLFEIKSTGSVDFGGSEFEEAKKEELSPAKTTEKDQFGWWNLRQGDYLVQYNETIELSSNMVGLIQPLARITRNGTTHSPIVFPGGKGDIHALLRVGNNGIRIKQNARISTLIVFE